mmetsp:Transcript_43389/g.72236  ORF Transcript_43389/g.72236 Transcript_43389/m.72236 type:complete len:385 (+) Transcript_43389:210-1364(+)
MSFARARVLLYRNIRRALSTESKEATRVSDSPSASTKPTSPSASTKPDGSQTPGAHTTDPPNEAGVWATVRQVLIRFRILRKTPGNFVGRKLFGFQREVFFGVIQGVALYEGVSYLKPDLVEKGWAMVLDLISSDSRYEWDHPDVQTLRSIFARVAKGFPSPFSTDVRLYVLDNFRKDPRSLPDFAFTDGSHSINFASDFLSNLRTNSEVAYVLAHEAAHISLDHTGTGAMTLKAVPLLMLFASWFTLRTRVISALIFRFQVSLPTSRSHEKEADLMAISVMARAGYDPRHSLRVLRRWLKEERTENIPDYMDTHPSVRQRISYMQEALPSALKEYDKYRWRTLLARSLYDRVLLMDWWMSYLIRSTLEFLSAVEFRARGREES